MDTREMDTREELRPYKRQRLGFEGVLVDIIRPNRRNGRLYGLVFGSVYAPNQKIEIDHVVIQMDSFTFKRTDFKLFTRYYFTASVKPYYKAAIIMGVRAEQENFMLTDININKLREFPDSHMEQPTMFVKTRIDNIMLCKGRNPYTKEMLLREAANLPNDGSAERLVDSCSKRIQQSYIGRHDMNTTLYA